MNIFYNSEADGHNIVKVFADDIDYLAKQLEAFVSVYRQDIYMPSDDDLRILNELEYYARLLKTRQYDKVISNANEIIDYNGHDVPWI